MMTPGPASLWRQRENWSFQRQKCNYITKEIKNTVTDSGKHRCYKLLHIITKHSTRKWLHMHKIKILPGERSDQTGFQYCCTLNIETSN